MKKKFLIAITILCTGLSPIVAFSAADDVFTCSKNGQATGSAGSQVPLGGPYVPVADYAVELNTGLLVYKECVLRVLATTKRKAALASVDNQTLTRFNAYPSRELGKEEVQLSDKTVLRYLKNDSLSNFSPTVQGKVKQAIARGYSASRDPRTAFICEYTGDLNAVYSGVPIGNYWDGFNAVADDPACSVLSASDLGYGAVIGQGQYEVYKNMQRYNAGQGVYDVWHEDENGFHITDTPGQVVLQQGIQSVQSSYKQAQEADDIGEMVDGLYLGVTNQVLTPGTSGTSGGLSAITQALGGALSYMAQVAQGAGTAYTEANANVTVGILQGALALEQQYNAVMSSTASMFTQTNASLRTKEAQCFTSIAGAICQSGTISGSTCTGVSGGTLTIATSTAFSQKVIDANVRTLATATVTNLNASNQIITRLNAMITALRANPTEAAQTAALAQLAALNPHNAQQKNDAQTNQQALTQSMTTLLSTTFDGWAAAEPVGWCNIEVQSNKDAWTSCWSGNAAACPTP